jgi:predicted acetyltransferase
MPDESSDRIVLRSPTADELRAWLEPLLAAFASDFSEPEFEAERPVFEPERLVNAFEGEERVASAGAFSMRLTVPGGIVPASGITGVGVRPDRTRRGILRKMMDWLLADAQAHHEPVAILLASEGAIYQRFGFGNATLQSQFEVDRGRVALRSPLPPRADVEIRMVDIEAAMRIFPPIYAANAQVVPGTIERSEVRWRNLVLSDAEWIRRGRGPTYRVVLEVGGEPRGYAIYRAGNNWSPQGPAGETFVVEVVGLDPETEQRLWQWLMERDLTTKIVGWRGPVPHPLFSWVLEPRRLGMSITDALYLRILDLPAALTARTYARDDGLVLAVADDLIHANAGRWQLTVGGDGRMDVATTKGAPDLELDIGTLACAYLGAFRFADLARAGRIVEHTPGALQTADVLFTPSRAPYSNTFF